MGRLKSIGNSISLIEMSNKTNIDDVIEKCNKTQTRMGHSSLFNLGHFDKNGRKVKRFDNKETMTYDKFVELREQSDMSKISFKSILDKENIDDEYDDEYICEVCPHRCTSYDQSLCDTCNDCEECTEYIDNECSGCSYSIHRDNSYYWERHPGLIKPSESDEYIMKLLSSDSIDFKGNDFKIK